METEKRIDGNASAGVNAMAQNVAHALGILRARFPHVGILFNPCDGRWYALWAPGGFMVASSALELRERLSGLYRHRIS